jgi:hypothetical protein
MTGSMATLVATRVNISVRDIFVFLGKLRTPSTEITHDQPSTVASERKGGGADPMMFTGGMLLAVAIMATVIALSLQSFYGHAPIFAALGQMLAILGAAVFAWWIVRCQNGHR